MEKDYQEYLERNNLKHSRDTRMSYYGVKLIECKRYWDGKTLKEYFEEHEKMVDWHYLAGAGFSSFDSGQLNLGLAKEGSEDFMRTYSANAMKKPQTEESIQESLEKVAITTSAIVEFLEEARFNVALNSFYVAFKEYALSGELDEVVDKALSENYRE